MAADRRATLVRAGRVPPYHIVCQTCGNPYTEYGDGCPHCRATAQAAAKLEPVTTRTRKPENSAVPEAKLWHLGIRRGTAFYATPEDAAEEKNPLGYFSEDQVRKWESSVRTWKGFISKVSDPDRYHKVGWVRESPEVGVFKRKLRKHAESALV
jgi:hypothetical protein